MFRNFIRKLSTSTNRPKWTLFTKNYAFHWKVERIEVVALVPAMPIAWFFKAKVTDSILAGLTCFHMYHGLSQISTDYLRRMPRFRKYFMLKFSFMVFNGMLFNIILRDNCGYMLTIHRILHLKPQHYTGDFPFFYDYAEDGDEEIEVEAEEIP